jgi:hypothetical protein
VPMSEWKVVLKEHHPGYITWEQFEENQCRLQENTLMRPNGEASAVLRDGRGLLQGLIRCGVCGRRMSASYPTGEKAVRYNCWQRREMVGGQGVCQSIGGTRIERAVVERFLEAVEPASMEITIAALDELDKGEDAVLQQLEDQLKEAQYQAERAQRQYDAVEPENRKVARTLETAWNERLAQVAEVEARIERHRGNRPPPLSEAERKRVLQLGVDVRAVWEASTTTSRDKKQILRAAFEAVFVRVDREAHKAHVTVTWQGGATTELEVQMPRIGQNSIFDDAELVEDVRKMAASMTDKQIARALRARRVRTASGLPFSVERVKAFRIRHGIAACRPEPVSGDEPVYMAREVADELGVSLPTVLRWLKEGFIAGEQVAPYAPWQIRLPDSVRLKTAAQTPDGWLPVREAARVLGVCGRSVLHSIQSGDLEAVLGGRGRRRGLRVNVTGRANAGQASLFTEATP